jgi:chemotaxis protein methyltransferase WspC
LASQLADKGLYDDALAVCSNYSRQGGAIDPNVYYLMGVIEHASGNIDKAESHFSKAIYLKPDHLEALTYLALLADEHGDQKKAMLYKQRIKRIGESDEQ